RKQASTNRRLFSYVNSARAPPFPPCGPRATQVHREATPEKLAMSRMNNNRNAPNRPSVPPRAPRPNTQVSKINAANTRLNNADLQGSHNRSEHVGKTGQQLVNRNKQVATSFLSKHDQNKAAASVIGTGSHNAAINSATRGGMGNTKAANAPVNPANIGARTAPIVKVAEKQNDGTTKVF